MNICSSVHIYYVKIVYMSRECNVRVHRKVGASITVEYAEIAESPLFGLSFSGFAKINHSADHFVN